MADRPSLLDPFGLWRGLSTQLGQRAKDLAGQGVESDRFAQAMQTALGATLLSRKLTQGFVKRLCDTLNLPTRADTAALAERLHLIEERLAELADAVSRIESGRVRRPAGLAPASPPRTRRPPEPPPEPAPARAAGARGSRKARR